MKYLWFGAVLLVALLTLCISVNVTLGQYTAEANTALADALAAAQTENYGLAAQHAKKAADAWNTHLHFFASVLCHDETDEITAGFAELSVVEDAEFLQTAAMLLARLEHIAEMDLPLLHNIL